MTSAACCLHGEAPGSLGPLPSHEERRTAPVPGAATNSFDLLRRATQMMATGALTEDQARTLSRHFLAAVALSPRC